MADELDRVLEARLREALHAEADMLPLLVRAHDLERERDRRRVRRWAVPGSLMGAVAVIALLVGAGAIGPRQAGGPAGTSSPSATDHPLASYEELTALLGPGSTPVVRGERTAAGTTERTISADLGEAGPASALGLAIHCLGGAADVELDTGAADSGTIRVECAMQPFTTVLPGVSRPARITLTAPDGVRWRLVVAESGPPPTQVAEATGETGAARLFVALEVLEHCGSIGGCAYYADLEDEHGVVTTVQTRTDSTSHFLPAPGLHALTFRSMLLSDDVLTGSAPDQSPGAACSTALTVGGGTSLLATAIFRADSCEIRIESPSPGP